MFKIPKWLLVLARWCVPICIPVLLLVSPLHLFATPGFVHHEYARPAFPPAERFGSQERMRLSDTIVRYIRGWETLEELRALRTDRGEPALNEREVQHLVDVRLVMDAFFFAYWIALAIFLAGALGLWLGQREMLAIAIRQGLWITGGLIALVLVSSFIDFDVFFTRFHQMFFSEGTWLFYETDTLIQLYPLPLWIDVVWKIGGIVLAEAALLYAATLLVKPSAR